MITAEELLKSKETYEDDYPTVSISDAHEAMIEFARLHLKEARKQFKIVFSEIDDPYPFDRNDKLLDVYPPNNIV